MLGGISECRVIFNPKILPKPMNCNCLCHLSSPCLQRLEQNFTSSQFFSLFLRHENSFLHTGHCFFGKSDFFFILFKYDLIFYSNNTKGFFAISGILVFCCVKSTHVDKSCFNNCKSNYFKNVKILRTNKIKLLP